MRDDDQGLLGKMIQRAAKFAKARSVHRVITCADCGVEKLLSDKSPCGSHEPVPETSDDTLFVRIGLVAPKAKITGHVVERKPLTNTLTYKRTDLSVPTPLKAEDDERVATGDKPIYRRKDDTPSQWGMSTEELNRKMDERASGNDPDNDPYI